MRNKAMLEKLVNKALSKLPTNSPLNAEAIRQITSLVGNYNSGNCWGTTLWTMNAIAPATFVDAPTMQAWLDRNTKPITRPAFGDILVIHNNGYDLWNAVGELSHTAVRIGNGLYWHQEGMYGTFKIGSLKDVLKVYPGSYSFVRPNEQVEAIGKWQEYRKKHAA